MALEMFHAAAEAFHAAVTLDPESPVLHYRRGCALWRPPADDRGDTKTQDHEADVHEAERELWLAHKLAPARNDALTSQLALVELVWLLLETKRRDEARQLAETFRTRFGGLSAKTAYALAHARYETGDLEGAISALEDVLRKQASHALACACPTGLCS